jgi:Tfp pilus assembly PilM family ATPase
MLDIVMDVIDVTEVTNEFLITKEFKTAMEFSQHIEKTAYNTSIPCLDVLVDYCVKKEIEMESVAVLLTASLKEKIRAEAEELNMLKRKASGKLPL